MILLLPRIKSAEEYMCHSSLHIVETCAQQISWSNTCLELNERSEEKG